MTKIENSMFVSGNLFVYIYPIIVKNYIAANTDSLYIILDFPDNFPLSIEMYFAYIYSYK